MIKKLTAAAVISAALAGSACAAETQDNPGETKVDAVVETTIAEKAAVETDKAAFNAPDSDWRELDPENTLYIDTDHGRVVVELYPEIAPGHVERIKVLTRQKFYDFITFHRVIEGFMNQTGDPKGDGTGDSDLPDLEGEFIFRRGPEMGITLIGARSIDPRSPDKSQVGVGFYKAMPVASQPSTQAMLTKDGKVKAFGLHCKGVTSMARSSDPNSANSQFFLMRGTAGHLDAGYTVWGKTVWGHDVLTAIKVGTKGETADFVPDRMKKVLVAVDVPEEERNQIQVMKTDSPSFTRYLSTLKKADGSYPEICDIEIPSRIKP